MNVLTGTTSAGMGSTVIMLVLMIAIFYFMLIRPENKRKKEAEQMRGAVKKGDKIVTIGGIVGVVAFFPSKPARKLAATISQPLILAGT